MSNSVFRDYDQAALDREYNNREKVPAFQQYFDRNAALSEQARATFAHEYDVAFGEAPGERLDIFPAAGAAGQGTPVNIFIHGGYWRSLDKREHDFVALGFVPNGVATVSINYDLAPVVSVDTIVEQCRAAVAWVYRHAGDFGGDPSRLYVSGHSAGGHLAAMMLATEWPSLGEDLPADILKGGLAVSGLYDLEPVRLCFVNEDVRLDEAAATRLSPVLMAPPHNTRAIVATGGLEGPEFIRQGRDLADAWRACHAHIDEIVTAEDDHFSIVGRLAAPDDLLVRRFCAMMGL